MSCTIDEKGKWHKGELPNSALDPHCLVAALLTKDCNTCQGVGTIDERLGGYSFSNPEATCPDCSGTGEVLL